MKLHTYIYIIFNCTKHQQLKAKNAPQQKHFSNSADKYGTGNENKSVITAGQD